MTTLDHLKARFPDAETFRFGDSARMSAELLALVRQGSKTATCGALRDFQEGGEAMPQVGRKDIAQTWEGAPSVVIETLSVEIMRFCDVPEDFALAEGENDTYDGWHRAHRAYFERHGGWSPDMLLVCERFRVVEVVDEGAHSNV